MSLSLVIDPVSSRRAALAVVLMSLASGLALAQGGPSESEAPMLTRPEAPRPSAAPRQLESGAPRPVPSPVPQEPAPMLSQPEAPRPTSVEPARPQRAAPQPVLLRFVPRQATLSQDEEGRWIEFLLQARAHGPFTVAIRAGGADARTASARTSLAARRAETLRRLALLIGVAAKDVVVDKPGAQGNAACTPVEACTDPALAQVAVVHP